MQTPAAVIVFGQLVNTHTGCTHYHSPLDVIAIKMKCCNQYYACYHCHEAAAAHPVERWTKDELDTPAILCGVCKQEWTINQYFNSHYQCPSCGAAFNPKCANHNHLYFDLEQTSV